jgi:hypothetical protein
MPETRDISYFETKARQCFRLARACTDKKAVLALQQLGYEFAAAAVKLGADSVAMPREWFKPEDRR